MSYQRLVPSPLHDGVVLDQTHIAHMEDGIVANETMAGGAVSSIAQEFSTEGYYPQGSLVMYNGQLYIRIAETIGQGEWVAEDWEATNIKGEMMYLNDHVYTQMDLLTDQTRKMIAPVFSTADNYAVGDIVHNDSDGKLYRCISAVTAGAWDSQKWAETKVTEEVIRFDKNQSLTDAQKAQARINIGAGLGVLSDNERINITGTMKNEWLVSGSIVANDKHLMSQIITVESYIVCSVDSGYQIAAFLYASGVTDRANYSSLTGWRSDYIVLQPGERYSVVVQKSNSGTITLEDLVYVQIRWGYGKPGYAQTNTLASVTTFATIRKPGVYFLAGGLEITNNNLADMPTEYSNGGNVVLIVRDYRYSGNHFYLQTMYSLTTPMMQWTRFTKNDGTPWNAWTKIASVKDINTSILAGKKISFYGDSITTYTGYIPSGNVTWYTGSNCGVSSVNDCWWKKLIDALGLTLVVNNSWSGRFVCSHADTWTGRTTNAGYKQANIDQLASNGTSPDIIVVFMGINDFNNEAPLGNYDGSATNLDIAVSGSTLNVDYSTPTLPTDPSTFTTGYAIMLDRIMTTYPLAQVYCCTMVNDDHNPPSVFPEVNGNGVALSTWNEAIRKLARAFGAKIIDFDQCGITHYNMETYIGDYGDYDEGDGVHPNAAGHSLMANQAIHDMDTTVKTRY